jgi:hypothetical protein
MKIIGLGHYSRTGKDSLANALVASLHELDPKLRVVKLPFAWKLKDVACQLYGWAGLKDMAYYDTKEHEHERDVVIPAIGKTPVQIWVALGTPAIREQVHDRTWIDYVLHAVDTDVLIIPDVRFPNEVEAIKDHGGKLVKVVRPGYGPRKTKADRALLGWDGWDYVFGGSGQMLELQRRASDMAGWLIPDRWPRQSGRERLQALAVEVVEPWECAA